MLQDVGDPGQLRIEALTECDAAPARISNPAAGHSGGERCE